MGVGVHAGLWMGTAASWVDLHPAEMAYSEAYGAGGGQQVGRSYRQLGGFSGASLWSGTAASWVDLTPAGLLEAIAYGVNGGQQVGKATVGSAYHASLWSGTAGSWVDLNRAGSVESIAWGVNGGQQVGYAIVGGVQSASLWSGTAASWVDLQAFVQTDFTSSVATGIWHDASSTYVVGYGLNVTHGLPEALMWVSPVPEPASLFGIGAGLAVLRFRRRKN